MRTRRIRTAMVLAASTGLALTIAGTLTAGAQVGDSSRSATKLCGWNGNVVPLLERAERRVSSPQLTARIKDRFGPDATVTTYARMEVDLYSVPGRPTKPMSAATLTRNHVTYNLLVTAGGTQISASAQVRFNGLCHRTTVIVNEPWIGSTGTDQKLRISANRALKLAQDYRRKHADAYPLDQPLYSMNLMQATTVPPDFGKLRWYVNYANGMGGVNVLAVYMDGTVRPA